MASGSDFIRLKKKKQELDPVIKIEDVAPVQPQPKPVEERQPNKTEGTGKKEITFDKSANGNVKIQTQGGQVEELTREEYNVYNQGIGGGVRDLTKVTPKVKELIAIEESNRLAKKLLMQGTAGNYDLGNFKPNSNKIDPRISSIFDREEFKINSRTQNVLNPQSAQNIESVDQLSKEVS